MFKFGMIIFGFFITISTGISLLHAEVEKFSTVVSVKANESLSYIVKNGYLWSTLTTQSKLSYLRGLQDGISMLTIQIIDSKRSNLNTGMETVIESHFLLPSNTDFKKLVSTIDRVYANRLNKKIPIIDIYLIAIEEGKYKDNMRSLLEILRDKYKSD